MSSTPTRSLTPRPRVLSGMRPTGRLHLGNYMGALRNWVRLQQDYDCFFFIADIHALTTDYADPSLLKQNVFDIALDFFAAGLNPGKCTLFVQSHVPQHAELHLLFSMFTPLGWLERVPTYKDQQAQLSSKDLSTYGFLGYPLLQSADILLYKPDFVPVGADQVAHVELTREVARRFNGLYSPKRIVPGVQSISATLHVETEIDPERVLLPEPQVLLTESPKLPGLDGRKMSKSYGNAIYLTDDYGTIGSKMLSMTNGGQRPTQHDPGDPDICPVGDLHRVFSPTYVDAHIRTGCRTATIRCDECKTMCANSIYTELQPMQKHRRELELKPDTVWSVLQNGAERAAKAASATMVSLRAATGLSRDLSGIRLERSVSTSLKATNPHDLSGRKDWWGLEPPVLGRNLQKVWREDIAGSQIALKPEAENVYVTRNGRRTYVAASQQASAETAWVFSAKPKSYELLVILCWQTDFFLRDFIVPQKAFLGPWVTAKRQVGKGNISFSVVREDERFYLHILNFDRIDITEYESSYGLIGD